MVVTSDSGRNKMAALDITISPAVKAPIGITTNNNVFQDIGSIWSIVGLVLHTREMMHFTSMCIVVIKMGKLNPPRKSCINHLLSIVNDNEIEYQIKAIDTTSIA